jgi:hypothetical protein
MAVHVDGYMAGARKCDLPCAVLRRYQTRRRRTAREQGCAGRQHSPANWIDVVPVARKEGSLSVPTCRSTKLVRDIVFVVHAARAFMSRPSARMRNVSGNAILLPSVDDRIGGFADLGTRKRYEAFMRCAPGIEFCPQRFTR